MVPVLMIKGWLQVTGSGYRYSFHSDLYVKEPRPFLFPLNEISTYEWYNFRYGTSIDAASLRMTWVEGSAVTELSVNENPLKLLWPIREPYVA